MAQIVLFVRPDGSFILRRPAPGFTAEQVATHNVPPETKAHIGDDSTLPTGAAAQHFRSTWRLVDGRVVADVGAAQAKTTNRISATAKDLVAKLNVCGAGHVVDGNADALNAVRAAKATVVTDAAASIAHVTDHAALAAHEPPSFAAAQALIA